MCCVGLFCSNACTPGGQRIECLAHQVIGTQCMLEPRVHSTWKYDIRKAQLLDVAKSLEPGMGQYGLCHRLLKPDEAIDRIVDDFEFAHGSQVQPGMINL